LDAFVMFSFLWDSYSKFVRKKPSANEGFFILLNLN
jgi:hypothetical protein